MQKKYLKKEIVKAQEMTMEEAYNNKLLPNKKMLHDFEKSKKGYLIETENNSKYWISNSEFTKFYKSVETPIDRMLIEYDEEYEKYKKGEKFINSINFQKLKNESKILLKAQNQTQKEYCYLLNDRINQISNQTPILSNFDFGTALKVLKAGGIVNRSSWKQNIDNHSFIISYNLNTDIFEKYISPYVKNKKMIYSTEQLLIVNQDNTIMQWIPSYADIFATDWKIVNL